MSPPRKTLLRPLGLITEPAKFGWYKDGACQRAINCVMRSPGELQAAPSMSSGNTCGSAGETVHKIMPLDSGHLYTFSVSSGGVWNVREQVQGGASNSVGLMPSSLISTTNLFSSTGRISPVRAKDRMLVPSNNGVLVGDSMAPTSASQRELRIAGLPQPHVSRGGTQGYPGGGALPYDIFVNYAVVHTRKASDGYTLESPPSPIVKIITGPQGGVTNYGYNAYLYVSWDYDLVELGDVFELYRSDGLKYATLNDEASTTLKLVASHTVTSGDIGLFEFRFDDTNKMGGAPYYQTTGRELYCNPGQGGATTINRQPPIAACTATFDGRVFYGNTTDRPRCTVQIPGGVGKTNNGTPDTDTEYFKTFGIGSRAVPGLTATIGSAVLTGGTATTLIGIKPGQRFFGGAAGTQWPSGGVIVSVNVGAGTITMNTPASASGTGIFTFSDVLYIGFNGGALQPYRIGSLADLLAAIGGASYENPPIALELTANVPLPVLFYAGQYTTGVSLSFEPLNYGSSFTTMQITATNGANYSPPLPEYNTTAQTFSRTTLKNRITWSKDQQPEHVPPGDNETYAGLREVIAMQSTRDALWIACLDGIFRLTGFGGLYRLDQVDSTKIICAPQAMTVLDEDVYVYTNFGLFMMNSETRKNITDMVIGDLLPGPGYKEIPTIQLCANEHDLEIVVLDVASNSRLYVYATREGGGWTTLENTGATVLNWITALAYQRSPAPGQPQQLIVGASPLGASAPLWAGWGGTTGSYAMDVLFQPIYQNDPVSLKHWIECSYIFSTDDAGKTLRPVWNGTGVGSAAIALYQNAAYARAGVPRDAAVSQSIMVGFDSVSTTAPSARFLGLSVLYNPLTTQAKQRT
jgi:hypothetical protein